VDEASLTRAAATLGAVTSAIVVGEMVLATVVAAVVGATVVVGASVVAVDFAVVVRFTVVVRRTVVAVALRVVVGVGAFVLAVGVVGGLVCAVATDGTELASTSRMAPSAIRRSRLPMTSDKSVTSLGRS
jgi:hypothetical protein